MNALPQDLMWDSDEASRVARVHRNTFLKHVRAGTAPKPTVRSGRRWLWPRAVILNYLGVTNSMLEQSTPAPTTVGMGI